MSIFGLQVFKAMLIGAYKLNQQIYLNIPDELNLLLFWNDPLYF